MKRIFLLAVLALSILACGQSEPGEPVDITGGWQLVSGTADGAPLTLIENHPVTIEFNAGLYGGTAACNGYGGSYSLDGDALELGAASITEMACEPPETMTLERLYMTALLTVDMVTMEEGNLVLSGPSVDLVFQPLAAPETADLLGTVWVLDTLIQGETASSAGGERATLEFFSDGSFIGSTGCRGLTGTYIETAIGFSTTEMAANGECPEELHGQDSLVVTVLGGEFRVLIEKGFLTLTVAGDEGLTYRAAE
jgi:heat shock protein HslJ